MHLVQITEDPAALSDVDLAVEAVPERMELKRRVVEDLDRRLPPLSLIASNTSALAISELGDATARPDRVAGFHFFYPAHTMRLIEIVAGRKTSRETLDALSRLAEEMHKLPIRVREGPGFVVNRILSRSLAEVFRYQEESGDTPEHIDAVMKGSGAVPMGPYQLTDQLGLDVALEVQRTMEAAYGERFRPGALLVDKVAEGHLGVKTGEGFYRYGGPSGDGHPTSSVGPQDEGLVRRFRLAAFCQAALLVEEGAADPRDIDWAMRAGAGLPLGPLEWADREGLTRVAAELYALHAETGNRFQTPASLEALVRRGWVGQEAGRGYRIWEEAGS
jgi:3-hydroxyacyl-CoA dehydrogenase